MVFVGVDPGKRGAIAVIDERGNAIDVIDMPETEMEVVSVFERIREMGDIFVAIEIQTYMPKQRGVNELLTRYGFLLGVLQAFRIRNERISPNKWKRSMGVLVGKKESKKKKKLVSIEKAQQLFPNVEIGKKDGRAEALLIAEYARRTFLGGKK